MHRNDDVMCLTLPSEFLHVSFSGVIDLLLPIEFFFLSSTDQIKKKQLRIYLTKLQGG